MAFADFYRKSDAGRLTQEKSHEQNSAFSSFLLRTRMNRPARIPGRRDRGRTQSTLAFNREN